MLPLTKEELKSHHYAKKKMLHLWKNNLIKAC